MKYRWGQSCNMWVIFLFINDILFIRCLVSIIDHEKEAVTADIKLMRFPYEIVLSPVLGTDPAFAEKVSASGANSHGYYCQTSNIRHIKSQYLDVSQRLILQLSLPNPLKPCVKSRMKMQLEQRRQAMLQLHLSDQQLYCLLRYGLY